MTDIISAFYEALKLLRSHIQRPNTDTIIAFLCLCERDGLSAKELAFRCGMSPCQLTRSLKSLQASAGCPVGTGLVYAHQHKDDRRRIVIRLSEKGCELRDYVIAVGNNGRPISQRRLGVTRRGRPPKIEQILAL